MVKEKTLVPKRRFSNFEGTEQWDSYVLGDIVEFFSGLTYSPSNVVYEGGTFVLRSSNIQNGEIVQADNVYVSSEVVNSENVQIGDIVVVVRNGSRNLLGKHAEVKSPMEKTVIGAFMTGIRYENSSFLKSLLDTKRFNEEISKNIGATINQITNGAFKKMTFYFPQNYREQIKIGKFFQTMDNLINLQQQKITKLKNLKSGYLNDMFPKEGESVPKLRFAGFEGPWKESKLFQLGDIITGSTPSTKKPEYYSIDGIPWVTPTDISSNTTYRSAKLISKEGQKVSNIVPKDTILVTCIASIGKNTILGTKGSFNQQINALIPNIKENNPYFLFVSSFFWSRKMKNSASSGTMQIVNKTEFSQITFKVPNIREQAKIGEFFRNLDNQIKNLEDKLKKLKQMKQAYLNEMFV